MLIGGNLGGERIEFGLEPFDQRLPVDLPHRDAFDRIQCHRLLASLGRLQHAIQLQILAHRPAAGEHGIGVGQIVGSGPLCRRVGCSSSDQSFLPNASRACRAS